MLIIHHWDTDGICSAAKLVKELNVEGFVNMSPEIGDFSFSDRIREEAEKHDEIYVLDLNLPGEALSLRKKLVFIDHHIQERIEDPLVQQINPLVEGRDAKEFPSCSMVLADHFRNMDWLGALGAFGDIGDKAYEIPGVREALTDHGIPLSSALKMVELLDSNYLSVDRDAVEGAVMDLTRMEPSGILEHPGWARRSMEIEESIKDAIDGLSEIGPFAYIDIATPYNIISKLARRAVWELGYRGALVVNRDFHGMAQTYLRVSREAAERMNMSSVIARLREMGINAGGKKEVVGSVYPRERIDEVLSLLRPIIEYEVQGG
ncbi:MAG: DHH family protein [Thermoplasmatota archaeon]